MVIFKKNKIYTFKEIINICNKNGLATVDCLQDDNIVSVEKEEDGDCLFEFTGIGSLSLARDLKLLSSLGIRAPLAPSDPSPIISSYLFICSKTTSEEVIDLRGT